MDKPGKACVVVNFGNEEETAEVTWPGGEGTQVEVLMPFQPDTIQTLPARIRLAPRTCAVIGATRLTYSASLESGRAKPGKSGEVSVWLESSWVASS